MNEAKLKACPFCGSQPVIKQAGRTNYWWVGCEIHLGIESQGCGVCQSDYDQDKAIRKWNERAGDREPEAAPTAELKPVRFSELLAAFDDALNQNPFLWIEIGYTRPTDWMVHVWDRTRKTDDDSTIITTQSTDREAACQEATQKLRAYLERGGS
jgi:hypothetical protein